ncbi:MAG TPA: glycoside hydrolase family 3 N-terminal domain-containing protein [Candidatus Saccharibacteria bacterium]|nr:glycoside hydrolase family 3 N-terminal domain-containing protein [Candidatus Saccharibacteria bacterium]
MSPGIGLIVGANNTMHIPIAKNKHLFRLFCASFILTMLYFQAIIPLGMAAKIPEDDLYHILLNTEHHKTNYAKEKCATTGPTTGTNYEIPAEWGIRGKLAQLLMVSVTSESEAQALIDSHVGGVFLMGRQFEQKDKTWIEKFKAGPVPMLVAADEEGGKVQRFRPLGVMPSAREMGGKTDTEVQSIAKSQADKLAGVGLTMDFAPVADLDGGSAVISPLDRAFSKDPAVVEKKSGAFAEGLRQGNLIPVFKHFPGHGYANGDSHKEVVTTSDLTTLKSRDLKPYEKLLKNPKSAVMLGHLNVPGLTTGGVPTSLSPETYKLLRETYGFNGVAMTDDIGSMVAIKSKYGVEEATSMAIAAGADMAVFVNESSVGKVLDRLEADYKVGKLTDQRIQQSLDRINAIRQPGAPAPGGGDPGSPADASYKTYPDNVMIKGKGLESKLDALIKSDIVREIPVYKSIGARWGVPWQALAATHWREGSSNPEQSMINGRKLPTAAELGGKQYKWHSADVGIPGFFDTPEQVPGRAPARRGYGSNVQDIDYSTWVLVLHATRRNPQKTGAAVIAAIQDGTFGANEWLNTWSAYLGSSAYGYGNYGLDNNGRMGAGAIFAYLGGLDEKPGAPQIAWPGDTEGDYDKVAIGADYVGGGGGGSGGGSCTGSSDTGGNAAVAGDVVATAINLAWPDKGHGATATQKFLDTKKQFNPTPDVTDCGGFVATVMLSSGVDTSYPKVGTGTQLEYLRSHPEKYTVFDDINDTSKLLPGDILIYASGDQGHTFIYVGTQGGSYNMRQASLGSQAPQAGNAYLEDRGNHFSVARIK